MQGTCIPVPGWRTKVPYASGQLNPHAATRDPTQSGVCVPQLERSAAVKIQHSTTKTQDSKKKKKKKYSEELNKESKRAKVLVLSYLYESKL